MRVHGYGEGSWLVMLTEISLTLARPTHTHSSLDALHQHHPEAVVGLLSEPDLLYFMEALRASVAASYKRVRARFGPGRALSSLR